MTPNFVADLKERFERFLSPSRDKKFRLPNTDERSGIPLREDGDRLLREYELYHWGSAPGPWH